LFAAGHPLVGEDLVAAGRHYQNRVKYLNAGDEFEIKLRLAGNGRCESSFLLEQLEAFLNMLGGSRKEESFTKKCKVVARESNVNI
jgi:transcription-repair coupling factor (superfamily II helicase)